LLALPLAAFPNPSGGWDSKILHNRNEHGHVPYEHIQEKVFMLGSQDAPLFQCPICGYQCPDTRGRWSDTVYHATWYLAGRLMLAMALALPLRTLCVHPDGSGAYGGSNSRLRSNALGGLMIPDDVMQEVGSCSQAEGSLSVRPPRADRLDPAQIERYVLLTLAGPIAAQGLTHVTPEQYPEEFGRISALHLTGQDESLQDYQDIVLDLLWQVYPFLKRLTEKLDEDNYLTEAEAYTFCDTVTMYMALRKAGVRFAYREIEVDGEPYIVECIDSIVDEDRDDHA
jgi:hypothetical protein